MWFCPLFRSGGKKLLNESSDLLKLNNVTLSDNGTYSCVANNSAGSQIKNFDVIIIGEFLHCVVL